MLKFPSQIITSTFLSGWKANIIALVFTLSIFAFLFSISIKTEATQSQPPAAAAIQTSAFASAPEQEKKEITVYVTDTGSKYHRGSCRHLRRSKIPISLKDAKRDYDPCSVCHPPR